MSSMKEKPDWPRFLVTSLPCPPGLTDEQVNDVVLAMCRSFWAVETIPVVGWGGELDGCELFPPYMH